MTRPAIGDTARGRTAGLLLLAVVAWGCGGDAPATGAEAVALGLFELARVDEPEDDLLRATFDPAPDPDARAALLDALSALVDATEPQVVELQQAEGPTDAWVDLTASLPGGGQARYSVRLRETEPGSWRVTWFQGPGVEWPRQSAGRGDGLSSSAPPETPR